MRKILLWLHGALTIGLALAVAYALGHEHVFLPPKALQSEAAVYAPAATANVPYSHETVNIGEGTRVLYFLPSNGCAPFIVTAPTVEGHKPQIYPVRSGNCFVDYSFIEHGAVPPEQSGDGLGQPQVGEPSVPERSGFEL